MVKQSKVLKINEDLHKRLCEIGNISEVILKLVIVYTPSKMRFVQKNGEFFLEIGYNKIPYNVTTVTKAVRVPADVYNALMGCKLVPGEDLNCVLFRLFTYYENRPKLPILLFFHGRGCGACVPLDREIQKFSAKKSNQKLLDVIYVDDGEEKECNCLIIRAFGVQTIPQTFILDPDCNVLDDTGSFSRAEELQRVALKLHAKYGTTL